MSEPHTYDPGSMYGRPRTMLKVPEILAIFWVVKVVTTALGESVSDYCVHRFDPIVAVAIGGVAFCAALAAQLFVVRYVAWVYWAAVAMVAVFGTMAADVVHVKFGVSYAISTMVFSVALAIVFVVWRASEGTVSIHTIDVPRRELFYWATVLVTFALGTAAGDMTAKTIGLGYAGSTALFVGVIAIPAVAWRYFGMHEVVAFWFAYVVTRPLGASIADWFGKPSAAGGLGFGDGVVSAVLAVVLVGLVAYLAATRVDVTDPSRVAPADQ